MSKTESRRKRHLKETSGMGPLTAQAHMERRRREDTEEYGPETIITLPRIFVLLLLLIPVTAGATFGFGIEEALGAFIANIALLVGILLVSAG
ncbi:MAG: hypothetical protein F4X82_00360 [Candidatus Spechtbacteria bacterium SB0662_bin_43]|uniref:Uncharacterized protein n=1 Tax=Candidatus Spechtbacteria bacterium SB0662_bin_43 TaxID=2604897 RepID=A0A845DDI1_9BACT|nr:hypothetical protein [Candidatus Spechtbacteria bacterium SB0662_bin_43]